VNLIIPNQGINLNKENKSIYIPSLKLSIQYYFNNNFIKINQIIINNKYCFISVEYQCPEIIQTNNYIGVDMNVNSHCAVVGIPTTGKIKKLGKKAKHIHSKYKNMRKNLQKHNRKKKLKQIKKREKNIVKDLNHKISKEIVKIAKDNNCGIKLENLKGIRKAKNRSKDFRYSLNSWSFYQLMKMIEYKSRLQGIEIILIDPAYTSKTCSRCGALGNRQGKQFECSNCGHVDHADANAAFNIGQSVIDRDIIEGNPDIPEGTILIN
jgi:putative transposase